MMKSSKKGLGAGGTIAAVAAIAALAAGTFFMAGNRGKKNRAVLRGWILQAKGEVLEQLERLKEVDMDTYLGIVESVLQRYRNFKDISAEELETLAHELRGYWKEISKNQKKSSPKKTERAPAKKIAVKKKSTA